MASLRRAIEDGTPHDVEYRVIAPDGTERWVEGKGLVERDGGRAVRMSGVCMIVTPRKEAEHARLASAEEASRLKDDFLATLSHELRTPLNAILGWVQMLLSGTLPADRARQAIDIIGRNAKTQAQLIEDILDISRMITGKLEIETQVVSVPHLMDGVVSAALPAARLKQITISKHVPDGLPPIDGDPKRLHQVLSSVITNAIQFTPEKGTVDIGAAADDGSIEITVRDSGAGIPAEFLPHVFDRFRQADSRATRRHGGLGLGLAIARHVLEQHRGEIRAHSDGPGRGTTITMRLPARPVSQGQPVAPHTATHGGLALRLDGAKVVVVDDQRDSCELLAALFEQCGAQVVQCANAPAALSTLLSSSVQLLVADIAMPDVDGYDLIRQVRQIDSRLPAVAVTAYAYPQDRLKALAAGFTAYCAKPIDATHFLRIVRNVMLSTELSAPTSTERPRRLTRTASPTARTDCFQRFASRTAGQSSASVHRTPATHVEAVQPLRGWHRTCNDRDGLGGPAEHASERTSPPFAEPREIMAMNRASLSDTYGSTPHTEVRNAVWTDAPDADALRRTAMVVVGFVLALVSLTIGSFALVQVWLAPAAAVGAVPASGMQSWESLAMILAGGVGFAAGATLVGIGMGRWRSPRPPESEADYTGPGDAGDMPDPPRVV